MGAVDSMKISTVLPVLNEIKYIDDCLNSLIGQTYPANQHTVLVMDGGSTDGTIDRINEAICNSRDYTFDFFSFKTMEKAYLMKVKVVI